MKFIDEANIKVNAGNGGKGHISFRKEKYVPKGGPDGGNGGNGGNIIIVGNRNINTLLDFKYKRKYEAENGANGGKNNMTGRTGKNKKIKVPVGTVIYDLNSNDILADITEDKQEVIIAKGGMGGKGNAEFATAVRQAPRFAQPGTEGEIKELRLELKLLADVGIVGLPNVGKSTLISVISSAKPKIADYHFTTLIPNLGVVKIDEYKNFVVADIPGLIKGASKGKGLGHQFLKHVERSKILLFMFDALSDDIIQDYEILTNELLTFNPEMRHKKRLFCINKIDSVSDDILEKYKNIEFEKDSKCLLISAATGKNIKELKLELWNLVSENNY